MIFFELAFSGDYSLISCVCVCFTELKTVLESEELMVNVAATINNLSFYQEESSALRRSQLTIAKCKTEKLTDPNIETETNNIES